MLEQDLILRPKQEQLMGWAQHPFQMVGGIEVLDNIKNKGDKVNLEEKYKRIRDNIFSLRSDEVRSQFPDANDVVTIEGLGSSGVAKGSFLMGMWRLFRNDLYLHDWLIENDVHLEVVPILFALYAPVTQLPETHQKYPKLAVPPHLKHGEFDPEHYRRISKYEWNDVNRWLAYAKKENIITVFLKESPITSYPLESFDACVDMTFEEEENISSLELIGIDRGNSVAYKLALDRRTRPFTYIGTIEQDNQVTDSTRDFRLTFSSEQSWQESIRGEIHWTVTLKTGEEVDVADLPPDIQELIVNFVTKATASPKAIEKNRQQMRETICELYRNLVIQSPTEERYYRYLQDKLGFIKDHFWVLENRYLKGDKTYDLDYIFNSLAVRFHPEIIDPILLSYIQIPGLNEGVFWGRFDQSSSLDTPYTHPQP